MDMDDNFIKYNFGRKKFDAVVCLDGNIPDDEFFGKMGEIIYLAADGAALRLIKRGIEPDYVIGDLDTFYVDPMSEQIDKSKIIHKPSQDINDFEKTLIFAKEIGYENVLIIGFHGGELEHTLNNWSIFKRYSKKMNLCIYDRKRYGMSTFDNIELPTRKKELISLIPQPSVLLTTKNLHWELINEKLELGLREGARNIAAKEKIFIQVHEGELIIFFDNKLPFAPEMIINKNS